MPKYFAIEFLKLEILTGKKCTMFMSNTSEYFSTNSFYKKMIIASSFAKNCLYGYLDISIWFKMFCMFEKSVLCATFMEI